MFKVKSRIDENIIYTVYGIKENEYGIKKFLTFSSDMWMWRQADEFVPLEEN